MMAGNIFSAPNHHRTPEGYLTIGIPQYVKLYIVKCFYIWLYCGET